MSTTLSQAFLDLQAQVAANTSVEQSALALIQGIEAQLAAALIPARGGDDTDLKALQATLSISASALAAAVSANTPAASPAASKPAPDPSVVK